MCGIVGILSQEPRPTAEAVKAMLDAISHRGPDDWGIWIDGDNALGHVRLSIIDLSNTGHQPMATEDGTIRLVFNGEIYNYIEIRNELKAMGYEFHGQSDTEVLIQAYLAYGEKCVDRFNGMFAFAIWDARKNKLFAARDRMGIKPFYYYHNGNTLIFGSEIKALLAHPSIVGRPDTEVIRRYLLFGNNMSEDTWYKGVRMLPPASALSFQDGRLDVCSYWDLRFEPETHRSFASLAEELRSLLQDAIRIHLRSDVPVGAYLSGGIDSSSIVAMAAPLVSAGLHTFSAAFEDGKAYDERPYINVMARAFNTHHHQILPTADGLPGLLPRLIWHLDEPVIGPAILPMFRVCEEVRKAGVKVVNGGQGGDELFGGYPPFYATAAKSLLISLRNGYLNTDGIAELKHLPSYLHKGGVLRRLVARFRPGTDNLRWLRAGVGIRAEVGSIFQAALKGNAAGNPFDQMTYIGIKHDLPGLLQQEDRMSMAWSVESRVPLLDHRVVEFSGRVPSWMKVRRGVLKSIFRESMRGIVPDVILDRTDKKGYPTPTGRWFAGPLRNYLLEVLATNELLAEDIVDPIAVRQMIHRHFNGEGDHGSAIWNILNLELWLQGVKGGWKGMSRGLK